MKGENKQRLQNSMQHAFAKAVKEKDMKKSIKRPQQVYNAVVASPGKKAADYASYTATPLSSTGKILAKAELAGLLKRATISGTGYWTVAKPWSQEEYAEASRIMEESWHSPNKSHGVEKAPDTVSAQPKSDSVVNGGLTEEAIQKALAKRPSIEGMMAEGSKMELPFDITTLTLAQAHYVYRELGKLFK